jgi:hypothetical protein
VFAQAVKRQGNRRLERSTRVTAAVRRQSPDSAARIVVERRPDPLAASAEAVPPEGPSARITVERHPDPPAASAAAMPPKGPSARPAFDTREKPRTIHGVIPRRDPNLLT